MIIVKILGILDILCAFMLWISGIFHFIPKEFMIVGGLYLLIKGVVFLISMDFASVLDVICSIVFFTAATITIPKLIIVIVSIFLLQKGIFSILTSN